MSFISDYKEDVKSFLEHDPAASSAFQVVMLYPGFKALRNHRKAN
ncbi:MAG: serine O-acetyltransferase, partial [Eubacterium sp.]|nr:serine O-acetyltransferase [Eubacterium sp.]